MNAKQGEVMKYRKDLEEIFFAVAGQSLTRTESTAFSTL
jgi:hypothetical protein